jgi:hypothetical protein
MTTEQVILLLLVVLLEWKVSDNDNTVTKSRGAKGSIISILWHYT